MLTNNLNIEIFKTQYGKLPGMLNIPKKCFIYNLCILLFQINSYVPKTGVKNLILCFFIRVLQTVNG